MLYMPCRSFTIRVGSPSRAEPLTLAVVIVLVGSAAGWSAPTPCSRAHLARHTDAAPLTITSTPRAIVSLGGHDRGTTPTTLSVAFEHHAVALPAWDAIGEPPRSRCGRDRIQSRGQRVASPPYAHLPQATLAGH